MAHVGEEGALGAIGSFGGIAGSFQVGCTLRDQGLQVPGVTIDFGLGPQAGILQFFVAPGKHPEGKNADQPDRHMGQLQIVGIHLLASRVRSHVDGGTDSAADFTDLVALVGVALEASRINHEG